VLQLGLATGLAVLGFRPELGFLPSWIGVAVGIFWIAGLTNAFNLLDGIDGLSAGVALVSTSALLAVMAIGRQPDWLFFLATLGGCLASFLRYNWHPARAFLGSAGSLTTGYLLAMASLLVTYTPSTHRSPMIPLLTPLFILAIPLYDTFSVIVIRLRQRRPVTRGDQSHFHHRMMKLGYTQPQAVAFILLVAFAVAIAGVGLPLATPVHTVLILLQIAAVFAVLIMAERIGARVAAVVQRRQDERRKILGSLELTRESSAEEDPPSEG
jgi:UDP-GlcNAc:undecaprenyl-phosphate GlcNAc-1-phosphate transferase